MFNEKFGHISISKEELDKLGLKCGIEIHQQLNTRKLFCNCPCDVVDNSTLNKNILRKLRFSQSETGEIDEAAKNEFKKGKFNEYIYNDKVACLVDLDEQPPEGPNKLALKTALQISQMLNLKLFDKFVFMRKLIIDGSIVSGYQRTAMLGVDGYVETSFGKVKINGINLEEDSARNVEKKDIKNIYALDRQGIPLVEITTAPDVKKPIEAKELASQLGDILRSFKFVKRGLGTIRQDLNVSIIGGARVEIKGAQNLKLIDKIVESEMKRQKVMINISNLLKERGIDEKNFSDFEIYNVSEAFKNTESKVILENLKQEDSKVLAIKLNGFNGILGIELNENYRFATEISNKNKAHFPQIKGLFHSDELPKYGITEEEVKKVKDLLDLEKEDAFILIVNNEKIARDSLNNVLNIIKSLINGPIEEVRQVDPKGTLTIPLRPMPGSARMYPETDIPEVKVDNEYLEEIKKELPELYSKKIERLSKKFGVEKEKIDEILENFEEETYFRFLEFGIKPSTIYSIIFELPKEIRKKENLDVYIFDDNLYYDLFRLLKTNKVNKNIIYDLYIKLYKSKITNLENLDEYLEKNNLISDFDEEELIGELKKIVSENKGAPFGALMGMAMKKFGGKVDGKLISQKLRELI
jgi:glutamyl-tRNA(Gln) amidotransferase subunit E